MTLKGQGHMTWAMHSGSCEIQARERYGKTMVQGNNPCYLPTKHHLHYLLYKNWTQQVCLCLRECLMAGFYLSCSTLSFHIGDRFSSCLNLGRDTEASGAAEITPRNRLHFFCTERTAKRPESILQQPELKNSQLWVQLMPINSQAFSSQLPCGE